MAGTCGVTTPMRSPINRVLLAARYGVFVLFILESFITTVLAGGNLVHKAETPFSIDYNLALVIKSIIAFLWMIVILLQDLVFKSGGLFESVWCELTWLSIFAVTELGGGIVLVQETTLPGRLCDYTASSTNWNICFATTGLSAIALLTGILMSIYFITLAAASYYHAKKYPVFHLLCPVRDFNWFPAASSDQVKMSYEPSIGSFASSPNTRATPRISPRNMVDVERALPVTLPVSSRVEPAIPSGPSTKPKHNKARPPPLKLMISEPLYSYHVNAPPVSFAVEPQGPRYPQFAHTLNRQTSNNKLQQFGANYI